MKERDDSEVKYVIKEEEKKPDSIWKELRSWGAYLVIAMLLSYVIITYVGQRTKVEGESMLPSLEHGDNLIVDKLSYHFTEPERYDIVVFPYEEDVYYIKRIIGLPGETVQIIDGEVYVNGQLLGETYGRETMEYAGIAEMPIQLGEDEYFLLGDNRNHSADSREASVGPIEKERLLGKAFVRTWPLDRIGVIRHE